MPIDDRRYTHRRLPMKIDEALKVGQFMHRVTRDPSDPQGTWSAACFRLRSSEKSS